MPGEHPPPEETLRGTLQRAYDAVSLSLADEASQQGISVDDEIKRRNASLRERMAYWIIGAFIVANLATVAALGILAWLDQGNIQSKLIAPGDRIITSQVFMALLGATTVQVGAIMVIIARYLFPGRPS